MKHFIRRLSRVTDSSRFSLLRSHSPTSSSRPSTRSAACSKLRRPSPAPQGYIPVAVGDNMERFLISTELLSHPVFLELLKKSAQEYGYEHKGALRIPCPVPVFERVLEALRLGAMADSLDLEDMLSSFSGDLF